MIGLFLISGVRLYGEGLRQALERRFTVAGVAADAPAALREIRALPAAPAIVLLDITVPAGLHAARTLRAATGAKVVAFGVHEHDEDVIEWIEAGAAGFVSRDASLAELEAVLEAVARGETPCSPRLVTALVRRVADAARERAPAPEERRVGSLTRRERQIVRLIDEGLSNKEIAARLQIELPTVKNHVHHALEKLEVSRRSEAAAVLRRTT
jgi:DNA-binding NarL/FixJ family response regulator